MEGDIAEKLEWKDGDENALKNLILTHPISGDQQFKQRTSASSHGTTNSLLNFFGFHRNPFGDSLDTSFLYQSNIYETALLKMLMSIEYDISFGLVVGKSGTGKTLLSQSVLERLPKERYQPILIPVSPNLSKTAFLKIILKEFNVNTHKFAKNSHDMIDALSECILATFQSGIKPVLLIDESHFLSSQALHTLRTLSNFEAHNKKLITFILFAEEHFLRRLSHSSYASLRNRMYIEMRLTPLGMEETKDYVQFRLLSAGNGNADFFSNEEIEIIFKESKGIARTINKVCTNMIMDRFLAGR